LLELEAPGGLLDEPVVLEEGTVGLVGTRLDVDEFLAEERLGTDGGRRAARDLLTLVEEPFSRPWPAAVNLACRWSFGDNLPAPR
jgi:hypothetical protein